MSFSFIGGGNWRIWRKPYAISVYHHYSCEFEFTHGDVNSIQYDVINFVSDLREVGGFLQILQFPPRSVVEVKKLNMTIQ
jgi:hypothetical protein